MPAEKDGFPAYWQTSSNVSRLLLQEAVLLCPGRTLFEIYTLNLN